MVPHVNMLINVTRMFGNPAAWDYNNDPAFLQPVYKAVAIISLVRDYIFTP